MNTLDYIGAGAECGDAGINLAGLELTGIVRTGRDPGPDVSPISPGAATPGDCYFVPLDDSRARDAEKYTWLPPDAPRIPRRDKTSTYVKFWLFISSFIAVGALEVWGVVAFGKWVVG